jgi:hypothetical protein
MTETREELISRLIDELIEERRNKMAPQTMDPMSADAQAEMEVYAEKIQRHAREVIAQKRVLLRMLNDQRAEE